MSYNNISFAIFLRPDFGDFARLPHLGGNIPEMGERHPSNFYHRLRHRGRFRKCNEIADRMGYVGEGAPRKSKKLRKSDIAWAVGVKFTGV